MEFEEKIKTISNQELIGLYRILLEHKEFLENEKSKLEGNKND